jgi:hypothetical protein
MTSTIITVIIVIAIIALPVWLLMHLQGAEKGKFKKAIAALSQKEGISISENEPWGNKIIGVDREQEKAALIILGDPHNRVFIADLKNYSKCNVEKNLLNAGSKGNAIVYSSIVLRFVARSKSVEDLAFPLYTDHEDMTLSNELQIAGEWSEKLNGVMRKHN